MTDIMREMIAELMGAQREEEDGRKLDPYYSRKVCRNYLIGCCPREKLTDTRLESFVSCRKIHEAAHKADYNKAQEKKDHYYDVEAFDEIEATLRVIDGEVENIKAKVQRDIEGLQDSHEFMKSQKVVDLTEKINSTLQKAEELGSEGKVEESMELAKNVEDMRRRKRELEAELRAANPTQQRLRVCEICGAQLNVLDHETRLQDHYGGKMHLGMVDIRDWYTNMKEKIEERREAKRKAEGDGERRSRSPRRSPRRSSPRRDDRRGDRDRDDRRDRYRDDRRDRGRDYDRRDRDRGYDRRRRY